MTNQKSKKKTVIKVELVMFVRCLWWYLKKTVVLEENLSRTVKALRLILVLAYHSFRDAGRRQILGTETKDFVTHGTAGSMIFMFALVLLAHPPKFYDGNADAGLDGFWTQFYCATAEEPLD